MTGDAVIRVLLADDESLVRTGFRLILEAHDDIAVVGEASDGEAAAHAAAAHRPDVVLMDVRMPVRDGISATAEVVRRSPGTRVVIVTTFDLDAYVFDSLRAGASGFLLKDTPRDELVRAVRVVAAGDALLSPAATRRLVGAYVATPAPRTPEREALHALTPREREVLTELARGRSNAEIAAGLVLSEHTVKTHVASILSKLHLRDRVQAVVFAYEHGAV